MLRIENITKPVSFLTSNKLEINVTNSKDMIRLPHPGMVGPVLNQNEEPIPNYIWYFSLLVDKTKLQVYENEDLYSKNIFRSLRSVDNSFFITSFKLFLKSNRGCFRLVEGQKVKLLNFIVKKNNDEYVTALQLYQKDIGKALSYIKPELFTLYFEIENSNNIKHEEMEKK